MFIIGRWRIVKLCTRIFGIVVIFGLLLSVIGGCAIAQADDGTKVIITSRFILWDTNEKMIDPHFSIHLFYINATNNNTASYSIMINGQVKAQGVFFLNRTIDMNVNYTDIISMITVNVNNKTVMTANNVFITEGVTQAGIRRIREPFTINLLPWEWSAQQWNIFYAIVGASLLSLVMGYRMVKYYRKHRGVQEIT